MAARAAWTGAITLRVDESGLSVPIAVRAYNRLASKSADSFKTLCPCHGLPVVAPKRCSVDDVAVDTAACSKGVEVGRGDVRQLPPEAVDAIANSESTKALEILNVAPRASVPLTLGGGHFALVADEKVPGSEQPVTILWNGLHANDLVVITEWVTRAGSRNQLVAIHADDDGLWATVLPYISDFKKDVPVGQFDENETAAEGFTALLGKGGYQIESFDHTAYTDGYRARREDAVAKALAGEKIEIPDAPAQAGGTPDLMALLGASLADAKAPPKKAAAKNGAKVAA